MRESLVSLLISEATNDPNLILLTGDLGFSVLEPLQSILGDRFLNAGVAEANMVSMAGALAQDGFHVYVYSIAPFLTLRCFEQIRNDVSYGGRPVRLIGVGAGLSYGTLGPSHHSLEDTNVMAQVPAMAIASPATENELIQCHKSLSSWEFPVYFRIPRIGAKNIPCSEFRFQEGAVTYLVGSNGTIFSSGPTLDLCLNAANSLKNSGIFVSVVSIPILHPFPADGLSKLSLRGPFLTVFEGYPDNPLELGIMKLILNSKQKITLRTINTGKRFASIVGSTDHLRDSFGLSESKVTSAMRTLVEENRI